MISALNTVSTAPPASTPSTWVRLEDPLRAASAAARRLALRVDATTASLAQVGLGELSDEDHAELGQRAELLADARAAGPERRQLLGEVTRPDDDHPGRDHRRRRVLALGHVALQDAREERRGVLPDVEAGVVLDQLEARHGQRMTDAVAEPEAVEHVLDAGRDVDEEVEPALLDSQPAAQRIALDPAGRRRGPQRV